MKLFVTFDGETKKLSLETQEIDELKKAICAKFDKLEFTDDTVLYVNDPDRSDVYFQLEDAEDIVDKASFKVLSRKALKQPYHAPVVAQAQQRLTPLQQKRIADAKALAARRAQNNAPPEFLPNGRVRIGETIYQIPRGGTGGKARNQGSSGLTQLAIGHPFRAVSPRTGFSRPASFTQILSKIIYGNPLKSAKMSVRQEKEHIKKEFKKYDLNKDGELSLVEFVLLADRLGRDLFPLQAQAAFYRIDTNKNGAVDFDEFMAWWLTECRAPEKPKKTKAMPMDAEKERALVNKAFAMFDTDGNGALDAQEFKNLTRQTGSNLTDAEVASIMKQVDTDGNGVITFDEFYMWFVGQEDKDESIEAVRRNVKAYSKSKWMGKLVEGTPLSAERREAKRRAHAHRLFNAFDADKNGTLDVVELMALADRMGEHMSAKEAQHVFEHIDTDGNGKVDFDEFYEWYTADTGRVAKRLRGYRLFAAVDETSERAKALRAFNRFDLDGNGVIDAHEFKNLSAAMGVKLSDAQIKQQIDSIDLDGNGVLSFDEFYAWWSEERMNAPESSEKLKGAMRAKRVWKSFVGAPLRTVDWDKVTPDNVDRRDDNDDTDVKTKKPSKDTELKEKKTSKSEKKEEKKDVATQLKEKADAKAEEDGSEYEYEYYSDEAEESEDGTQDDESTKKDEESGEYEYETYTGDDEEDEKKDEDSGSYEYETESEEDDKKETEGSYSYEYETESK